MSDTTAVSNRIKKALEAVKKENDKYKSQNPNSATLELRQNLYQVGGGVRSEGQSGAD